MHLFIDTHLNDIVYILYQDGVIIDKITISNVEHSKYLMPKLKELLNDRIPRSIMVVNGPGSFTSVRLGVTIAKTLAFTWNIPIRVISTLECLAVSTNEQEKIVAFSDNNGYYVGIFNDKIENIGDYIYISKIDYFEYSCKYNVITNIEIDYKKAIEFGLQKQPTNVHEVNPIYVKKLDVEK